MGSQESGDPHHVGGEDPGAAGPPSDHAGQHKGPQQEEEGQIEASQRSGGGRGESHRQLHREGRAHSLRESRHHLRDAQRRRGS